MPKINNYSVKNYSVKGANTKGVNGLLNYFGDSSDGTIPTLSSITTAPNGGVVENLWDGNSSTPFITTNSLSSATNNDIITIDFGANYNSIAHIDRIDIYGSSISTGVDRSLQLYYSSDNSNWTQIGGNQSIRTTTSTISFTSINQTYRYWKLVLASGGSGCILTTSGISINANSPTIAWQITFPVTINSGIVIKQFSSITLPSTYTMTTDNPCRGLILYSSGNVSISGTIDMSKKAGLAPNGNIIPMVITKNDSLGNVAIDKYYKLTTSLQNIVGGAGGNAGFGGGDQLGNSRSSGGIGGAGRINLGGFGAGAGAGAAWSSTTSVTNGKGGNGGSISLAELGGGDGIGNNLNIFGTSPQGQVIGHNGINGSGGSSGIYCINNNTNVVGGVSGKCYGAGGGGVGGISTSTSVTGNNAGDGEYAGGFVCIVCGGNVTINSGAFIKANGGNGGNGSNPVSNISGGYASAGGGGAGSGAGCIVILYHSVYTNSGTLQVNGGLGGSGGLANGTYSEAGGSGTSGSAGTIVTQQI